MEEVSVTWMHAARVWWSFFWRMMLWTMPSAVAVGFVVGIAFAITGTPIEPYEILMQLIGGLIGVFFSVLAMKVVLSKRFNGYRLALVKIDDNTDSEQGFNA